MKNWEIMAVPESRQGDSESWPCPALRPRNKRTRGGWPFKSDLSSAGASSDRGKAGARPAPSRLFLPVPAMLPRHSVHARPVIGRGWCLGGAKSLLSDRPARSGAGHVGRDVSRQFRLVLSSPPRGRLLPSQE